TFIGRPQTKTKRRSLPADFPITSQRNKPGPGERGVPGDLFRPEQQPANPLRRPARPLLAPRAPGRPLPERHTNDADKSEGQDEQRPFAGATVGGSESHATPCRRPIGRAAFPTSKIRTSDCEGAMKRLSSARPISA